MSRPRVVGPFATLWRRRTTLSLPDGFSFDVLSLPDLVRAKKTQRDKDCPCCGGWSKRITFNIATNRLLRKCDSGCKSFVHRKYSLNSRVGIAAPANAPFDGALSCGMRFRATASRWGPRFNGKRLASEMQTAVTGSHCVASWSDCGNAGGFETPGDDGGRLPPESPL